MSTRFAAFAPFAALVLFLLVPSRAMAMTYEVGPTQTVKSPCALVAQTSLGPGDVVNIDDGTYTDACQLKASGAAGMPITFQGNGAARPVFDATGLDLSGAGSVPRAIFQFTGGSHWVVRQLELKNASGSSGNGAAFRATADSTDIVITDVLIHDCQDGIMGDGAGEVTISNSEIFHNGAGDGFTHNFYMQNDIVHLVGNYIHDSNGGQNVKMRARYVELFYNYIANAGNYEIDLIQGPLTGNANANVAMIGNVVLRNPMAANDGQCIVWGSDDAAQTGRNGSLYAVNNTFVMTAATNRLFNAISPAPGSAIHLVDNIVHATVGGTAITTGPGTDAIVSGSNNWVTTGITAPSGLTGSVTGADPGFVGAADFHLKAGGAAVDKGVMSPPFVDGVGAMQPSTPTHEIELMMSGPVLANRVVAGSAIDLGAYEYNSCPECTGLDAGVLPDGAVPEGGGPGDDGGMLADGGGPTGDAGGDGNSAQPGASSGCSCGVGASAMGGGLLVSAWLLALAGFRRSRRPR